MGSRPTLYVLANMNIIFLIVLLELYVPTLLLALRSLFLSLLCTLPTTCDLHILYIFLFMATGNIIRNLLFWFFSCWYKSYLNYQKLFQVYRSHKLQNAATIAQSALSHIQ